MQKSWNRLLNRNPVKRIARSWFRGLEVTYDAERGDYHPHYHVLMYADGIDSVFLVSTDNEENKNGMYEIPVAHLNLKISKTSSRKAHHTCTCM